MDNQLRQIRVLSRDKDEIEELGSVNQPTVNESQKDYTSFNPGPCLHNTKFACVLVPCALPLFYIAGELLFGVSVLCLMGIYLVEHTSKTKRSTIVVFVFSVLALQLTVVYSLLPYLWKSIFNTGLLFIYNVFLVLSGGIGLLQFKLMQNEEPEFVVYLEYILFVAYPMTGQFVMTSVSALYLGWWTAPFFCILYGFLFIQVFIPPSHPSFLYHQATHKPGEERLPDRFILGALEKTLLLFNLLTSPGSMFIVIYLTEFLQLVTWAKLLFCGLLPVFLCTCLDIREVIEFLEFDPKVVAKVRWFSGLSCLAIFSTLMWSGGVLSAKVLPVFLGSVLVGLVVGVTAKKPETKVFHQVSSVILVFLYVFLMWSMLFNVGIGFSSFSSHKIALLMGMTILSVLCVAAVYMSNNIKTQGFNAVLVLQSVGMVICEHLLMEQSLYSLHYAVLSGLVTIYVISRLYIVGRTDWYVAWLGCSIHGSKLAMCISILIPQHALDEGFLFPASFKLYPTVLNLVFNLIVSKILIFHDEKSVSFTEGVKLCCAIGIAILGVYDVIILPIWLLLTNIWPSTADAIATVLFLWGLLCLRISLVKMSHNLDAKRLNIVLLCGAVLVEFVRPDFNFIKVFWALSIYCTSLVRPLQDSETSLIAEDLSLPWLLMMSIITTIVLLVKLAMIEQFSTRGKGVLSVIIGFPIGLKCASMILPAERPPFLCLSYGVSLSLVVFLLISSWTHHSTSARAHRGYGYSALVLCCFISLFLESGANISISPFSRKPGRSGWLSTYPSLLYHITLRLILAICLKKESPKSRETLEDSKGEVLSSSALLSSSFIANLSVVESCTLALMCTPSHYWEFWVPLCTAIFWLWRPEGLTTHDGRRINISPGLPAVITLSVCMYIGTIATAFSSTSGILAIIGFCVELLFLHCAIPTHYGLAHALWKNEIPLALQQLVVFCAPANIVLLVYCSTLSGRVLGVLGIAAAYWIFYYVECSDWKPDSK